MVRGIRTAGRRNQAVTSPSMRLFAFLLVCNISGRIRISLVVFLLMTVYGQGGVEYSTCQYIRCLNFPPCFMSCAALYQVLVSASCLRTVPFPCPSHTRQYDLISDFGRRENCHREALSSKLLMAYLAINNISSS